ncbi:flagellar protein FlgN [Aquitalea palustris]|uniref:Flagellar protein FlgN n=2 Tax=Aquitalea TaxID=407217 RepID=A0A454JDH2_9NEIS|nr:flagellar protein FlgN [Aquitalea palustris]
MVDAAMNQQQGFAELCQAETAHVLRLVELLQQEQQVMIAGQVHLLEALADSKSKVLDELARQSQQRGQLMKTLGLSDSDTVYIWLADKPAERQAWLALEDQIHRAQGINQLNGSFIEQQLGQVEESLAVLRQAAAATLSYDRGGQQPQPVGGRRFLGSA